MRSVFISGLILPQRVFDCEGATRLSRVADAGEDNRARRLDGAPQATRIVGENAAVDWRRLGTSAGELP